MNFKHFFAAVLFCLAMGTANAQQTGSFNTTIQFNNANRTLSCYVPTDYDSTQQYQLLIGLHGLGDNSSNYRNALINSLGWATHFPNTIFVFPDGGSDQNSDFHAPAGDENVILECIDFADQQYNIDLSDVILQGFSLGGRSALAFGLENPNLFKGLLLNTPAVQGKLDALNVPEAGIQYNYANATEIPIYTTVGEEDLFYFFNSLRVATLIKNENGMIQDRTIPNMDHAMPAISFIKEAMDFFDNPTSNAIDAEIYSITSDNKYCSNTFTPGVMVRNVGSEVLTSIEIEYQMGTDTSTYNWTGSLLPFESTEIELPAISAPSGRNDLTATILTANAVTDSITSNNSVSKPVVLDGSPASLPFEDGFEDDAALWTLGEDPSLFEWFYDDFVSNDGQQSICAFNTILVFYTTGNTESIISPSINTSGASQLMISYDIAYTYHRFTPPYLLEETVFADTLEVLISTDCGASYSSVFKAGGEDLATTDNPITNPLSIPASFLDPSADDWRTDSISITDLNADNILVKFDYTSALGGSINIDNFRVEEVSTVSTQETEPVPAFNMYPNPAQNRLQIDLDGTLAASVVIYDINGRTVFNQPVRQNDVLSLDVSSLSAGMYIVEVQANGQLHREKLMVKR
jgi:predicted esterase